MYRQAGTAWFALAMVLAAGGCEAGLAADESVRLRLVGQSRWEQGRRIDLRVEAAAERDDGLARRLGFGVLRQDPVARIEFLDARGVVVEAFQVPLDVHC